MIKLVKIGLGLVALSFFAVACNPAPAAVEQSVIHVTQSVAGQQQNEALVFSASDQKNALDFLKGSYQVQTKDFGPGLGEFVEGIAGVQAGSDEFWAFYVNGKSSNVGAGSYTPKEGDSLEWKLERIMN